MEVRRDRTKLLRILGSKFQRAHYERNIGTIRPVLFESEEHGASGSLGGDPEGKMLGYTDNYIRVSAPFHTAFVNRMVSAQLVRINGDGHMEADLEPHRQHAFTSADHFII